MQSFFLVQNATNVAVKGSAESDITKILKGLSTEASAEMDGKMSDSLRNILFGPTFQEDLASRNIFRGRDLHLPTYAGMAKCFGVKPDAQVRAPCSIFSPLRAYVGLLEVATWCPPKLTSAGLQDFPLVL